MPVLACALMFVVDCALNWGLLRIVVGFTCRAALGAWTLVFAEGLV